MDPRCPGRIRWLRGGGTRFVGGARCGGPASAASAGASGASGGAGHCGLAP